VSRVADLDGRIRARVDFTPDGDGYDRYGHGTHMIGLVAGDGAASGGRWSGVAPGADIVSVKVAGWDGATDVSVVIAAIQWVVSHRDEYGIRVLNLSFGTDATQTYRLDPLDRAVQRAWDAGILVVTSAGNLGPDRNISKPADDPHVLTVGASDVNGTPEVSDDTVAPFSSRGPTGDGVAKPDLVAPGISVVASRSPGSTIDTFRPEARFDGAYFKGTGTSQAAAVVSGIAALLFEADPSLTPDEAKAALIGTTRGLRGRPGAGAGQVDASAAVAAVETGAFETAPADGVLELGTGLGSIDASRGSHRIFADHDRDGQPEQVEGEVDVLGDPFDGATWAATPWTKQTWDSTRWSSVLCVGAGWAITSCGPDTWPGMAWDEQWWGTRTWSEAGWDQKSWTNKSWTQKSWTTGHWN
jgi:serine protease AprX